MSRLGRIVVPGPPHHVTQQGNRRQRVFFEDSDERRLGRFLRPRKPGPKPRTVAPGGQLEMGILEISKVSP